ncbi:MAG: hypothetical protein ABI488_07475 [Polyangiaceae bacterium]
MPSVHFAFFVLMGACGGREGLGTATARGGDNGVVSGAGALGESGSTSSYGGGLNGDGGSKNLSAGTTGLGSAGAPSSGGSGGVGSKGGSGGTPVGTPAIGDDGYVSIDAGAYTLNGYVGSFVGGSASSITLTYDPTSFCASGSVGLNSTYQSYAGAGFAVNQTSSPSGGTVSPLVLSASSITVNFSNAGGSPLRLQVIDSSVNYWCYDLSKAQSPVTIPLSKLNTHCWDNSGTAFTSGATITEIELIVPGKASAPTPYSFCLDGLVIK